MSGTGFGLRLGAAATWLALAAIGPAAAEGLSLERVKTEAPPITEPSMTAEDGKVVYTAHHAVFEFSWSALPQTIPPEGFTLRLSIHGRIDANSGGGDKLLISTSLLGSGFTTSPDSANAEIDIEPGDDLNAAVDVKVTPNADLKDGDLVTMQVGPSIGGGFTYTYRAGGGAAPEEGPQLTATLEGCPDSMVISELPGRSCHLMIGGFRRNTADPVEVVLPSAMDGTSNHGNGLQLLNTAGAHDVYEMTDPYPWLVSLFLCPGQPGAGVNCHETAAKPGPVSVPIVVRQKGAKSAELTLSLTAMPNPRTGTGPGGSTAGGTAVTSTSIDPAPGQMGARIECPGTIYISLVPSLGCELVISGWTRNTAEPVIVSLPAKTDEYGNHANGIQVLVEGESDVFSWEAAENRWEMSVFACPGQSSTGADCFGNKTTPGVQTVPIHIEQRGIAPADIMLKIDAQAHP